DLAQPAEWSRGPVAGGACRRCRGHVEAGRDAADRRPDGRGDRTGGDLFTPLARGRRADLGSARDPASWHRLELRRGADARQFRVLGTRERRYRKRAALSGKESTMAWLVVSDDNERGPAIRADARIMDAHWQYELANRRIILAAGSMRADDGVTKTGSLLVLDVATRPAAEAVFAKCPPTK